MNKIKKALYSASATALALSPLVAGAVNTPVGYNQGATSGAAGTLSRSSVFDLITNVMNWLLGIVGVLAVIAFVISGILYLTAAGDEEQVEKAKSVMMYAIIGLVVALIGLIIVQAVAGVTGTQGVTTF